MATQISTVIVHQILGYLDLRSLCRALNTCKGWHGTLKDNVMFTRVLDADYAATLLLQPEAKLWKHVTPELPNSLDLSTCRPIIVKVLATLRERFPKGEIQSITIEGRICFDQLTFFRELIHCNVVWPKIVWNVTPALIPFGPSLTRHFWHDSNLEFLRARVEEPMTPSHHLLTVIINNTHIQIKKQSQRSRITLPPGQPKPINVELHFKILEYEPSSRPDFVANIHPDSTISYNGIVYCDHCLRFANTRTTWQLAKLHHNPKAEEFKKLIHSHKDDGWRSFDNCLRTWSGRKVVSCGRYGPECLFNQTSAMRLCQKCAAKQGWKMGDFLYTDNIMYCRACIQCEGIVVPL